VTYQQALHASLTGPRLCQTDNGWLSCSVDASEEPTSGPHLGRLVNHGHKDERNARMKVFEVDGSVPALSVCHKR